MEIACMRNMYGLRSNMGLKGDTRTGWLYQTSLSSMSSGLQHMAHRPSTFQQGALRTLDALTQMDYSEETQTS